MPGAKAADPTPEEADTPAAGQSSPGRAAEPPDILPTLLAWLRTGATADGVAVLAVQVETADERVQRLELPTAPPVAPVGAKTKMYRRVGEAVDGMNVGDMLTYDELAVLANHGTNSGPFRRCVKQYAKDTGRLEPTSQGFEKLK